MNIDGILLFVRMFANAVLSVFEFLFVVRAIISWFPMLHDNAIVNFLYSVTEPVLAPIRAVLYKIPGLDSIPLDFSVLVAFLIIEVLKRLI